tara:strand:- start:171 stop:1160 length:990 start_codon:yes stop_codon:yes gene_type:complete
MNIAIIGCGKIGMRHFESLISLRVQANIFLIDHSFSSLDLCKKLFNENLKKNKKININVFYLSDIDKIFDKLDVAIIATSSLSRRKVLEQLLKKRNPKNIILEKFLFPKKEDYSFCHKLFSSKGINVWVNQWMSHEFQEISKYFDASKKINFSVKGNKWGICCNCVHYIDWFHSLIKRENMNVESVRFENSIFKSKRSGYYELYGNINIISSSGHRLSLECTNKSLDYDENTEIFIEISNHDYLIQAVQDSRNLNYQIQRNGTTQAKKILCRYQSERTSDLIEQINIKNKCNLVDYETSSKHHLLVYDDFEKIFLNNNYPTNKLGIPIT